MKTRYIVFIILAAFLSVGWGSQWAYQNWIRSGDNISYSSGDVTIDTNTLHVDATNNRVGIGTTSPLDKLHVFNGYISVQSGYGIRCNGNSNERISFNTSGLITFVTDNTTDAVMQNGKVGIGNSSPDSVLEVTGSLVLDGSINQGVDAEASDTYVVSIGGITEYGRGLEIRLWANTANTGAATININGLGAVDIKTLTGADPANNDIVTTGPALLIHNGTNFTLTNPATTCD
jgi:hypothetical protein